MPCGYGNLLPYEGDCISAHMTNVLENKWQPHEEPKLTVRRAIHAPVWSVWATLEGVAPEEIFEGASEQESLDWISGGGQVWLAERRRRRSE